MEHTNTRNPPSPSAEQAEDHRVRWETDPEYTHYLAQEAVLQRVFGETFPRNDDPVEVLAKVSLLNDLYNTNIYRTYDVALHILGTGADERLARRDLTLVDDMKNVTVGGRVLRLYSFAAKYCGHQDPAAYPIFDSYIETLLTHFNRSDRFCEFRKQDLREYPVYVGVLDDFIGFYGLESFGYTGVTRYLWMLGREYFNKFA